MSTALFLSIGSRGDTEPVLGLASSLRKADIITAAYIYLASDYQFLVKGDNTSAGDEKNSGTMHVIEADSLSMQSFRAAMQKLPDPDLVARDLVKAHLHMCGAVVDNCVNPLLPGILDDCRKLKPSLFVATTLGLTLAATVSEALGIPSIILHMQPNTPTSAFPCYLSSHENALHAASSIAPVALGQKDYVYDDDNKETYTVFANGMYEASLPQLNQIRKDVGLSDLHMSDVLAILNGKRKNVHMLQSYLNIVPRPKDLSPRVTVTPPLAAEFIRAGWDACTHCPRLFEYMAKGEAPLAMSVGSGAKLDENESKSVTLAVIGAFASADVSRVVILGDAIQLDHLPNGDISGDGDESPINLRKWAEEHVFVCQEDVQFAWLFPKCAGVIAHGGAGTVATALCAGVPVAILPHSMDQFFWAKLVSDIGLGANVSQPLTQCSKNDIKQAVLKIQNRNVRERVSEFGQKQKEQLNGCQKAIQWIETVLQE